MTSPLHARDFTTLHTSIEEGDSLLRVVKTDRLYDFDINSYARLAGSDFHNGVIEVEVCSRILPDAPDLARGFIGLAFHIAENDSRFESFYLRPANGRDCTDPLRRQHVVQYFCYPTYTFQYFRDRQITCYESPADIGLGEWIKLRLTVDNGCGTLSVNGAPLLKVEQMLLGPQARGGVGLFVDIGTEGLFRNLRITCTD